MTLSFTADNVEHNILTIDGTDRFDGMDIIAARTEDTP